ncbi:MAG TPA: hypothetical protein VFV59_00455 [Candidatus Limnocylindria bacterium]|nr:hypothetical protein [Candidatus Limnocylindria bacterium]
MNDHRDESLIDKIKNAFGMGDDGTDSPADDFRDDVPTTAATGTATVSPEASAPQAGFSEPFEEDLGDPANRPTGPDYGATDGPVETGFGTAATRVDDFGAGLDEETFEGTAATDTGPRVTPAGYDDPYETVAGPGPMGAGSTADADAGDAWTRGEAASGTSPFEGDQRREGEVIEQERRETGI